MDVSTFPGASVEFDFSDKIRQGVDLQLGDFIVVSFVHSGTQKMQPLNVNWNCSTEPWDVQTLSVGSDVISWPV